MTIELTILLSIVSVSAAVYFGLSGVRRDQKNDDMQETAQLTTMLVKLENINNGINKIESKMDRVESETRANSEKLIKVEESTKQAHKRIDEIVQKGGIDSEN